MACVAETGRIFSICFSERFVVRASEIAAKLVADGAIGRVVQTVGLGPHRLNRAIRPAWFFDRERYRRHPGRHRLAPDRPVPLLHRPARTPRSSPAASPTTPCRTHPDFDDFGEILLRGAGASGYIRVDWFTPDGLPTWGDGRLTILGTEGFIELRKYVDIAGRPGTDHVFLSNRDGTRYIDASREPLDLLPHASSPMCASGRRRPWRSPTSSP